MDRNAVDFVRLGYAGASLDFAADVRDVETFEACVRAIGDGNHFDAERVAATLGGETFGDYMAHTVGRAGSPLIVISVPFWTHQPHRVKEGTRHRPFTAGEREAMAGALCRFGRELRADEVTVITTELLGAGVPYQVRLWWD